MFRLETRRERKMRNAEMSRIDKKLQSRLLEVMDRAFESDADREEAFAAYKQEIRVDANRSWGLLHAPLLRAARERGLDIPDEYYSSQASGLMVATLTSKGEAWLRRELMRD